MAHSVERENEKCYPDIISVIALSDMYGISLDELLKGDEHMIAHLKEDTNVVSSNKKLYMAVLLNVAVILVMLTCSAFFQIISWALLEFLYWQS